MMECHCYLQAEVNQLCTRVLANDTSVAANVNLIGSLGDGATDNHNLLGISRDCRSEGCVGGDSGGSTTSTTGSASVLACETGGRLVFKIP